MMTDQELFKGTAQYYSQYRVGYGPEFLEYIIQYFKLDGSGRLLDLGCGTGQLTIPLAQYFEEVIGLDPEQEMLKEAAIQTKKAGVNNIKWLQGKAEDMPNDVGTFRLVTIGAAFHWMNQMQVLEKVYPLIEKGGGLVIVYDSGYSWATRDEGTEEWQQIARNIIKKYLGEKRRAGNSFYKKPEGDFDDLVEESSFGKQETWAHEYTRERDIKSILGFLYSTSFASRRLFGDKLGEFEKEFTDGLLKVEPSGVFKEHAVVEAIIARKE